MTLPTTITANPTQIIIKIVQNVKQVNLTIREDKIKGIYVAGVTEEYVTSHTELLDIMSIGKWIH